MHNNKIHSYNKIIVIYLYSHPDDIDLFAGGLSERHVVGGAMGPTFACIVARQFQAMKFGDRFWYENDFHETGLTEGLLKNLVCLFEALVHLRFRKK